MINYFAEWHIRVPLTTVSNDYWKLVFCISKRQLNQDLPHFRQLGGYEVITHSNKKFKWKWADLFNALSLAKNIQYDDLTVINADLTFILLHYKISPCFSLVQLLTGNYFMSKAGKTDWKTNSIQKNFLYSFFCFLFSLQWQICKPLFLFWIHLKNRGKNDNQRSYLLQFELFSLTQIYLQIQNEKLYVHF